VRELFSVVESAAIHSGGGRIEAQHLPEAVRCQRGESSEPSALRYRRKTSATEKREIQAALQTAEGSRTRAAQILGMSRTTLWRRMRDFGIEAEG
jgi:transcriptional activator for dhaKLM operon